jgi:hypothetical protein
MQFDHIAILLDEPGAGTPDEGVGMFVNADGQEADVETTSLIDAANSMKDGWWNKVKFFISNASEMSFDDIYQALRMSIKQDDKSGATSSASGLTISFTKRMAKTPSRSSSTRNTSSLTRS